MINANQLYSRHLKQQSAKQRLNQSQSSQHGQGSGKQLGVHSVQP